MKIDDLSQPRIGDIVEFETDPDTVVEGLIVGETADGYVYEFSVAGYTELNHKQDVAEGKIKLYTDPDYFGAEVDDTGFDSLPVVKISADRLVGFEPDSKMNQPKSRANVKKILAGLKKGDKLPPLLVRKYKKGYQILDGHHRFWAYKLSGTKSIPVQIVADKDIEEISKQGVVESSGYIPKNAKEAKDPRWSAALSVDVHTDTMKKQISAFFPSNPQPDGLKQVTEAEYHGRHVVLNRPLPGDVKKFKVYVKDPKSSKIKKVNFGDPNMRIHKSNPKRRKSFRARHRCDTNPGPKTKARYWSCRKW